MRDQTPKPPPSGRVVEGGVDARASGASVAINAPTEPPREVEDETPYYVQERHHHRIVGHSRHSLTEYIPENDTPLAPPYEGCRFHGHGRLNAQTDLGPMARDYMFPVPANDLAEAWKNFDDAASRAGAVEAQRFREDYQKKLVELARQQQGQLSIVQGQDAKRVLEGGQPRPPGKSIITP